MSREFTTCLVAGSSIVATKSVQKVSTFLWKRKRRGEKQLLGLNQPALDRSLLRLLFSDRVKQRLTGGAGREPGNQPISVHHNSSAGKAPMKVRIMPEWRSRLTNYKSHKASLSSASRFHGNVRAVRACVWSQRGIKETFSLPWSPKHGTLTETAPHYLIYDEFQESLQCEFFFNYFCVPLLSIFHFPLKTLWTL